MTFSIIRTSLPLIGVLAVSWLLLYLQPAPMNIERQQQLGNLSYVSGFFQHDQQPVGPEQGFRAHTLPSFGIIERKYDGDLETSSDDHQWQRLQAYLSRSNSAASPSAQYKVLFVGRHGEGVHNVKEREVGRAEWERYWSKLEGDGKTIWLDAHLTERGKGQAKALQDFWKKAVIESKIPLPKSYYTSPLARAMETVQLTYSGLSSSTSPLRAVVMESIREIYGVHTCDKRSSRSSIHSEFPDFVLSPDFTEEDELWKPDRRETLGERVPVMKAFLNELFDDDDATFVSLTMHSGAIRALCLAVGHPDVWVAAGAIVPIVVRRDLGSSAA